MLRDVPLHHFLEQPLLVRLVSGVRYDAGDLVGHQGYQCSRL